MLNLAEFSQVHILTTLLQHRQISDCYISTCYQKKRRQLVHNGASPLGAHATAQTTVEQKK